MPLSDTIKTLIRNAWDDGYPCLLATHGPLGPNITPKGSMIVFDYTHLAWWERSKRAVLENLSHDKRVCVMYANFKAQRMACWTAVSFASSAVSNCTKVARCVRLFLPSCCRASRPMLAPKPASASSSRSRKQLMFVASQLCERVAHGLRPQKISIPFQTK